MLPFPPPTFLYPVSHWIPSVFMPKYHSVMFVFKYFSSPHLGLYSCSGPLTLPADPVIFLKPIQFFSLLLKIPGVTLCKVHTPLAGNCLQLLVLLIICILTSPRQLILGLGCHSSVPLHILFLPILGYILGPIQSLALLWCLSGFPPTHTVSHCTLYMFSIKATLRLFEYLNFTNLMKATSYSFSYSQSLSQCLAYSNACFISGEWGEHVKVPRTVTGRNWMSEDA